MADVSDLESKLNVLKFQISVMGQGASSPEGDQLRQQISDLQKQIMYAKIRQGMPS